MTWEDIKQRKEDSIRESTGNPMSKSFEVNGKIYNSYTEYSNSDEHKELLKIQEEALEQYEQKAKEYYDSLETDNQLLLFFHVTNTIFENYFKDSGSYRGLLYDKFKFGPEAYSLGMDSGMFTLHNSISTPKENEERFEALMKFLDLDLTKEQMVSARNIFTHGFDNSGQLNSFISGQQKFIFDEDPE
jgi:alpha-glucuronidase